MTAKRPRRIAKVTYRCKLCHSLFDSVVELSCPYCDGLQLEVVSPTCASPGGRVDQLRYDERNYPMILGQRVFIPPTTKEE